MRIVFMGNPEFAISSLGELHSAYPVIAVVTNPDKATGRGRKILSTPVALKAKELGVQLHQPESLREKEFIRNLFELKPDLFVVVAFRILPSELLKIPQIGSINLHASLLPKYRGAAPIQWAILQGESVTGVTTFFLKPSVDTGDTLLQEKVVIFSDDDYGSLSKRMSEVGSILLKKTIDKVSAGNLIPVPQDSALATLAPKIDIRMCEIDWQNSSDQIRNLIRALSPRPGAFTWISLSSDTHEKKRIKIFKSRFWGNVSEKYPAAAPGEIGDVGKESFSVACGKGALEIMEVQLEGKKRMPSEDFLRGINLSKGVKLSQETFGE